MSGIECSEGVKEAYLRVKTRQLRWAIFGFNDKKDEILTSDASADPSGSVDPSAEEMRAEWECMCSYLPADDVTSHSFITTAAMASGCRCDM